MQHKVILSKLFFLLIFSSHFSQNNDSVSAFLINQSGKEKKWHENISIRGYAQVRYNGLLVENPNLSCEQCDRSWGNNNGFFFRRIRIIFFGQLSKKVYFYIQPDFASSAGTTGHIGQIRDAYFDVGLDSKNEFRFRIGQSKVPYGFENMQSSQNRLPLDRNDALNSAVSNERDLGVFFYWAPVKTRKLFSSLISQGLKGSGDYGVFGIGLYNGQTANQVERNKNRHFVTRIAYPFQIKNQIIEPAIQSYVGQYVLQNTSNNVKKLKDSEYLDQRIAGSLIVYPKPFGIMAEYNIGKGPEFNKFTDSIETQNLKGGYITLNYKINIQTQLIYPFIRYQYYNGGKKHELDARSYRVKEFEIGIEWQPVKNFELVLMYTFSERRYEDFIKQENFQKGSLLRIQAQVNF
jgi:hypothetical protein